MGNPVRAARATTALAAVLLAGCSSGAYYLDLARGQLAVLRAREPITPIIDDEARDPALRQRLSELLEARSFASSALALPDNDSYRVYAQLHRSYVVWNVFATPELSLEPRRWCHPLVGCFAYHGYYEAEAAQQEADRLSAAGDDVYVGGVSAYSTLGWFDDPVLDTMMRWDDRRLIGTVFHELAHQRLHVADDTAFNESYASFVEEQGWRQWQTLRHPEAAALPDLSAQRAAQFTALVMRCRERLATLYAEAIPDEDKRRGKAMLLARLRSEYTALRDGDWNGYAAYDAWFKGELNNARLLPFGLYDTWVPAFRQLFIEEGQDWPRFHEACSHLGKLPPAQREQALRALTPA